MKILLPIFAVVAISGCVNNDMSDLQAYVQKTKATYKGEVKALPEFKHQPSYEYSARGIRDPFKPVVDIEVAAGMYRGPRPDESRPREPLEEFSLDSLRMVGSLEQDGNQWVLIKDPDGLLHRVAEGHYMGRNNGRVIAMSEEIVSLTELIPNNKGWIPRDASIALSE
jgi:type IV pilus assembly protein PilP